MPASGRNPATESQSCTPKEAADEALELMERALRLIDQCPGAENSGAHLDLAIHRLRDWTERPQSR